MDILIFIGVLLVGCVVITLIDRLIGYKVDEKTPILARIAHIVVYMVWGWGFLNAMV